MTTDEIKGELLKRGLRASDVARAVGCSKYTVNKVIRGERSTGPIAVRVRGEIASLLQCEVSEVWPEDMPESVAGAAKESAESVAADSARVAA